MFCDALLHSGSRNRKQAVCEIAKRLIFLRRTRHLPSSVTPLVSPSANAIEQNHEHDPQYWRQDDYDEQNDEKDPVYGS